MRETTSASIKTIIQIYHTICHYHYYQVNLCSFKSLFVSDLTCVNVHSGNVSMFVVVQMELSPVCAEGIDTDRCVIKSDRGNKRSKVPSKLRYDMKIQHFSITAPYGSIL